MQPSSIVAIYFLFFAFSAFILLPFGVPVEQDRDDFLADATDAATRAYQPNGDDERTREAVRLAVRRCATLWTGKKPLVDVTLLQVAE